jgi:hypothetical protein
MDADFAKLKKSNATAGGAIGAAAKAIEANIVGDFAPLRRAAKASSRPIAGYRHMK